MDHQFTNSRQEMSTVKIRLSTTDKTLAECALRFCVYLATLKNEYVSANNKMNWSKPGFSCQSIYHERINNTK